MTAAERARRYRARKRDVTERHAVELDGLRESVAALAGEVRALVEVIRSERDEALRHGSARDVTERHDGEGAPAQARVTAATRALSGPRVAVANQRDAVTPLGPRIVDTLARTTEGASAPALADAVGVSSSRTLEELVMLQSAGLVRRIAGQSPGERDRWQVVEQYPLRNGATRSVGHNAAGSPALEEATV